jgi:hypothetical protein
VKVDIVVDQLPLMERKQPIDSTVTLGKSILSEEEDEEDAIKFGPVVDQFPSSRTSLAPNEGGDAWDDDYVDFKGYKSTSENECTACQ